MIYVRTLDGAEMIELAPNEAVNVVVALKLGLVSRDEVAAARAAAEQEAAAA